MHNEWEALIPFYIAHTLPDDQAVALAQHLATCELCQQALEEWRDIAAATEQAAKEWSFDLPPLSETVRARVRMPLDKVDSSHTAPTIQSAPVVPVSPAVPESEVNRRQRRTTSATTPPTVRSMPPVQQSQPHPPNISRLPTYSQPRTVASRRLDLPLLRIAAAMLVVIIGGAVLFSGARDFLSRGTAPTGEVAFLRTETTTPAVTDTNPFLLTTPHPTHTESAAVLPTWTPPEIESVTNVPENTISSPEPVITEDRSQNLQFEGSASEVAPRVSHVTACTATNNTVSPLELLAGPGVNYDVIDSLHPGGSLRVLVYTLDGWYQVVKQTTSDTSHPMWMYGGAVTLSGDCDRLLQPTPAPTPDGSCVMTGGMVNLYTGPGSDYPILNSFDLSSRPTVALRSDEGWIQVRGLINSESGFGWTNQGILEGSCDSLPYIASGDFVTEPLPVTARGIPDSSHPLPVIQSFTASSQSAAPGDVITLNWQVMDAQTVTIISDSNGDGVSDSRLDGLPTSGATGFTLEAGDGNTSSITLTLQAFSTANNAGLPDVTADLTINLICPPVNLLFTSPAPCNEPVQISANMQDFEHGLIVIRADSGAGFVLFDDGSIGIPGTGGDPVTGTPPSGFYLPGDAFLPFYQAALGWADQPPQSGIMTVQRNGYDPVQAAQHYTIQLPDGHTIRLEQLTGGNFIGWNSVNP